MTDILEHLFQTRGLVTDDQKQSFLKPNFELHTHDPFLLSGMDSVVDRIYQAIKNNETVGIFTDYDCDGIPGAVILSDFFTLVGHNLFEVYIPDRQIDGYGLAEKGIDFLIEKKCTLIITIDLGITGFSGAEYLKKKKIDLIVTDHHLPHEKLPDAFAIINPKKEGDIYPFKDLCGSGVVFKVIQAFLSKYEKEFDVKKGQEKWLLDMVGLATLSDMVPLLGENRVFAYYGMFVLKKTKRPGLLELYKQATLKKENLAEDDITHSITPKLNAASRMGNAYISYNLLKTANKVEAQALAKELNNLNNKRKAHVAHIMKEIHAMSQSVFSKQVIVVGSPKWRPGVLGLVAAKIVDIYQKPTFVWGGNEDDEEADVLKGSCRSISGISIVEIMEHAKEVFVHYGGHTGAGGFAIEKRNIFDLEVVLSAAYEYVLSNNKRADKSIDTLNFFSIDRVDEKLFSIVDQFAPFGLANERPVLKLEDTLLESFKAFGKTGEHTELIILHNDKRHKAIIFFKTPQDFSRPLVMGERYTILSHIEKSYFIRVELRLRLIDIY